MARTLTQTHVWRDEFNDELRELIAGRMTSGKIADVMSKRHGLKITRNVIIGQCHRQKLKLMGGTPAVLARAEARRGIPVAKKDSGRGQGPWSSDEVSALRHSASNDVSASQIAREIGRSLYEVQKKLNELGIAREVVFRGGSRPARIAIPQKDPPPAALRTAQNEGVRRLKPVIGGREGAAKAGIGTADHGNFVMRPAGLTQPAVDGPIPFGDRAMSQQCSYIFGDPRQAPVMCCGKDVAWRKDGTPSSWCPTHNALVYRPAEAVSAPEKVAA